MPKTNYTDEAHPGPVGRGEVEVEAAVAQEPVVDFRGLVGGEIIEDHMDIEICGELAVDLVEKRDGISGRVC